MDILGEFLKNGNFKLVGQECLYRGWVTSGKIIKIKYIFKSSTKFWMSCLRKYPTRLKLLDWILFLFLTFSFLSPWIM